MYSVIDYSHNNMPVFFHQDPLEMKENVKKEESFLEMMKNPWICRFTVISTKSL